MTARKAILRALLSRVRLAFRRAPYDYNRAVKNNSLSQKHAELFRNPEELIYRTCYASSDLRELLGSAETRSSIRRLPTVQFFFSLKELSDEEIGQLLPHLTEEQWAGILDLDLWTKDQVHVGQFLKWAQFILQAEDAVAIKILRATDPALWRLVFNRDLSLFARTEEDEFEGESEHSTFVTPDGMYLVELPEDAEKARLYHQLIIRMYQLDQTYVLHLFIQAGLATSIELEEKAYQERRRRVEDMGFQDYFDAMEIYAERSEGENLAEKRWVSERKESISVLPMRLTGEEGGPLLMFQALAALSREEEIQDIVEELFFVCNKLLSADQVSPGDPTMIKEGIRKAISGINLGLEVWSEGELERAVVGIQRHYLVAFFQIGFGKLSLLRRSGRALAGRAPLGSFLEAAVEGFCCRFPVLSEQVKGKIHERYFDTRSDLEWARKIMEEVIQQER